ncbi:MAG: hypothetical protein KJZ86_11865 [Caldilineaceae bacterium]|nr:hypothetical protein [Caldilineaceae bacterium]
MPGGTDNDEKRTQIDAETTDLRRLLISVNLPFPHHPRSISTSAILLCSLFLLLFAACAAPLPTADGRQTPSPFWAENAGSNRHPTLADFWDGRARFVTDVADTGLPMGESETVALTDGRLWSYVHASDRSAGVVDQCGAPVEFPGCVVIYESTDGGQRFRLTEPTCRFACNSCPCTIEEDQIDQQQYPRVVWDGSQAQMVYEHRGMVMMAESPDGYAWTPTGQVAGTGIWHYWFQRCLPYAAIGPHPFSVDEHQCLVGGPPGVVVQGQSLYIFVGTGRSPGSLSCLVAPLGSQPIQFAPCAHNPLIVGAETYGPLEDKGATSNPWFDFRTVSSAEVQQVGNRFYLLYEGVRGPGPGDPGDTQFGLGLARSQTDQIDGPWELFGGNPILVDMPGNIGLGHADLLVIEGQTFLYTSLDGEKRSRLKLVWQ